MIGSGLKVNWMELSLEENYGLIIEEKFLKSGKKPLILIGRIILTWRPQALFIIDR